MVIFSFGVCLHVKIGKDTKKRKRTNAESHEKYLFVAEFISLFESKYEGIVYSIPPPKINISSIHNYVQHDESEQAAETKIKKYA